MKKQVKTFGEFTRHRLNESRFSEYLSPEEEYSDDINIGDRVFVVGMDDIPARVVGFDEDRYGNSLVIVNMMGREEIYSSRAVYKLDEMFSRIDPQRRLNEDVKEKFRDINPTNRFARYVKNKILDDREYNVTYGGPSMPIGEYQMTISDLVSRAWEGKIKKGIENWTDHDWEQVYDYIKMKIED